MRRLAWTLLGGFRWCLRLAVAIVLDYPAAVVQAWILLFHLTWINALLLGGSLTVSLSARYAGSGGYLGQSNMWAKMFLADYPKTQLELLPQESYAHLLSEELIACLSMGFSWWASPSQLTVCIVRPAETNLLPSSILSYRSLSRACYIFLTDHPRDFTTYQKFCFLREVDYASDPFRRVFDREAQKVVLFWTLPWLALLASWNLQNAMALILMFVAYTVLFVSSEFGTETDADAIIREQIAIDHRALEGLTEVERSKLDEILVDYPLEDPTAYDAETSFERTSAGVFLRTCRTSSELSAAFRSFVLRKAIAASLMTGDYGFVRSPGMAYRFVEAGRIAIILGSGAAIAVLGQTATPWRLWTAAALAAFMLTSAIISWRYLFRTRKKIEQSIPRDSIAAA